jgi:hypothetical protein
LVGRKREFSLVWYGKKEGGCRTGPGVAGKLGEKDVYSMKFTILSFLILI